MRSVLITGSEGTVGSVLRGKSTIEGDKSKIITPKLTRLDVRPGRGSAEAVDLGDAYNRPSLVDRDNKHIQSDMNNVDMMLRLIKDHDVIIHSAWSGEGILDPASYNPENTDKIKRLLELMAFLGEEALNKTIVLFSSVNAHVPPDWRERRATKNLIDTNEVAQPHHHNSGTVPGPGYTRYGQSKLQIEALASQYSKEHRLDIIVPRLGGVNLANAVPSTYPPYQKIYEDPVRGRFFDLSSGGWEDATQLKHEDLVSRVQKIIDEPAESGRYVLENWVSEHNPHRSHKVS